MARAKLRKQRGKPVRRKKPSIGADARRILRQHASKGGGSSLAKLKMNWLHIVGEDIARICAPTKITGSKAARTLTLRVVPAAAAIIQHQEEMLRERISVAAGGNITRLKLEQGNLTSQKLKATKPRRELSSAEITELEDRVAGIRSPRLKAAIVALGKAVLAEER